MRAVAGTSTFAQIADRLLRNEFPGLPEPRRDETVGFAVSRLQTMASPIRLGVQLVASALVTPIRILGIPAVVDWLSVTRFPGFSDLPRSIRYLAVAYIWDKWPDTAPDGTPNAVPAARRSDARSSLESNDHPSRERDLP